MTKSARTALLVVIGLFVFGGLGSGVVALLLLRAVDGLGGGGEWSEDALPERELPATFGVRLPLQPLRYQSRQLGFQEAYFEVLVQLPPGSAPAFLGSNHLTRGAEEPIDPEVQEQVRGLEPTTPALRATPVELPAALKPDGGSWNLSRSGELLEAPGVLWVHLVAFET